MPPASHFCQEEDASFNAREAAIFPPPRHAAFHWRHAVTPGPVLPEAFQLPPPPGCRLLNVTIFIICPAGAAPASRRRGGRETGMDAPKLKSQATPRDREVMSRLPQPLPPHCQRGMREPLS